MSDSKDSHSGSRWEPSGGPGNESPAAPPVPPTSQASAGRPDQDEPQARAEGAEAFAAPAPASAPAPAPGHGSTGRSSGRRNRGALVGAALALTLVSGLAGFALGHVTAETDGTRQVQNVRNGFPERGGLPNGRYGHDDGDGDGFPERGFHDHDHDHDGDQGSPPGGTNDTDSGPGSGEGSGATPAPASDGGTA